MDAIFAEFFRLWGNIPYAIAGLLPRDMLMFPLCLYPLTVICSAIAAVKAKQKHKFRYIRGLLKHLLRE